MVCCWEVSEPRRCGGLDIGNLRTCNQTLLAKWLCRFPIQPNSLWHKVIASKYEPHPFEWLLGRSMALTRICGRIFLMRFPIFPLLFVVWLERVRIHIYGKISGWGIVLFAPCFPTSFSLAFIPTTQH